MKEICKAMITILLIILYVIGLAAAAEMSVSQQPTDVEIGDTFTVDVTVDPMGTEIYAAQYDLLFDSSILSATTPTQGDFLSQGGAETFVVINTIDNSVGKVTYSETRVDFENGVSTSGTISSITFEVIGDGISTLTLTDIVYATPDDFVEPEHLDEEPPDNGESEPHAGEEADDHGSSGSSNFMAAPAATTATPTTPDDVVGSDSTPPAAEARVVPTTETTAIVTSTKVAVPDAPSQSGFKAPGFEAASLVIVLLYLIKRRGE